jgi:hypothetical protein
MENASWKQETLLPETLARKASDLQRGYHWKQIFLPSGTKARFIYKGRTYLADVKADGFHYDSQVWSPSAFVNTITKTSRNAWNDIEVRFPDTDTWLLAADLREKS